MNARTIHNHDEHDLPFDAGLRDAVAAIHADRVAFTAPFYVGSIAAAQRGVQGSVGVELHLAANGEWLDLGPFRLPARELRRLQRLLDIAGACIGARAAMPPPAAAPTPESGRGIAGWDLPACTGDRPVAPTMARTGDRPVAPTMSDGGLSEGEDRP